MKSGSMSRAGEEKNCIWRENYNWSNQSWNWEILFFKYKLEFPISIGLETITIRAAKYKFNRRILTGAVMVWQ